MDTLDTQLNSVLRKPEPAIGDDGFSERVMQALPARRFAGAKARRWTLGSAAVAGGLLTALLGTPLENALGTVVPVGGDLLSALAVLFIAAVAVPAVWVFYAE